jgi:hypothetical protein
MSSTHEELRGVALKLPISVFNHLAAEAHARSLREGRVLGVATVIREAVADAFALSLSPEDDAALRGDRRKARTAHSPNPARVIRHRSPPGNRGNDDLADGATGCNPIGAEV